MAKGRPPDPGRAKRGTGHRALVGQAKPVEVLPSTLRDADPPASLPMAAHDLWRIVREELAGRGLTASDLPLVEMLVVTAARNRDARAAVTKAGVLLKDAKTGRLVANPMLKVEKETAATYLRLAETLGLSPASRVRLGLMQIAGQSMLVTIAQAVRDAQR